MVEMFEYSVTTVLPRLEVWQIFSNVTNWPRIAGVYTSTKWLGEPWQPGSCLRAEIYQPEHITFRYLIESCVPALLLRYIAHGEVLGFAVQRETIFEEMDNRTVLRTKAYCVGTPVRPLPHGAMGFLKEFTMQWYQAIAQHCDEQALARSEGGTEALIQSERNVPALLSFPKKDGRV